MSCIASTPLLYVSDLVVSISIFADYNIPSLSLPGASIDKGRLQGTVVGFKLSRPFKFFFDIINARMTFLDVKGPIK